MNRYGAWNPRGTTNSEYGKFNFFQNGTTPTSNQIGYSLAGNQQSTPWNQNAGSGQEQCQNVQLGYYGQQQGHSPQNYYHHPSCQNKGRWMQNPSDGDMQYNKDQGQGTWNQGMDKGQGGDQNDQSFSIHVGEEAATAALGGKANFHNHFSIPPNKYQSQEQGQKQDSGESNVVDYGGFFAGQQNDATPSSFETQPEGNNISGQGDAAGGNAEDMGNCDKPQQMKSQSAQPKLAKWRGLNSVKFGGRHIPPNAIRQQQAQIAQLQSQMQRMQMNQSQNNHQHFYDDLPRTASDAGMNCPPNQMKTGPTATKSATLMRSAAEKAKLCGKCTKCKNLMPQSIGPSTLTFPTNSTQNLRKPSTTSRSKHYLGRQDAKNFRAIQFSSRLNE